MAIVAMTGTDIVKANIISSRVGNPMVAGYLLAQGNELRKRMQASVVEFYFSKKDGSVRHAFGTTMGSLAKAHTVGGARSSIKVIPFFDVEVGEWRSCQLQSINQGLLVYSSSRPDLFEYGTQTLTYQVNTKIKHNTL